MIGVIVSAVLIAAVLVFGKRWFKEEDWRKSP